MKKSFAFCCFIGLCLSQGAFAQAQTADEIEANRVLAADLTGNSIDSFICSQAANEAKKFADREEFIRYGYEQGKKFWELFIEEGDRDLSGMRRYFIIGTGDVSSDFELGRTLEFMRGLANKELDRLARENSQNYESPVVDDGSTSRIDERFQDIRRWYAGRMLVESDCARITELIGE